MPVAIRAPDTGRVPSPPTLKRGDCFSMVMPPRVYGEGPLSPYIEARAARIASLRFFTYGEGPLSPYIEAHSLPKMVASASTIRGGSPLPLH